MALELVNKAVRDKLRDAVLDDVWAAHLPRQVDQRFGQGLDCIGKSNVNEDVPTTLAARGRYLRSRHATLRLRDVIGHAESRYNVETDRYGEVETVEDHRTAHPSLKTWWAAAKDAILRGADIDLCDDSRQTLLHWAVMLGSVKIARELCKAGLSTYSRNRAGKTPIHLVISDSRVADTLNEYRRRDDRLRWERRAAELSRVAAALGGMATALKPLRS